MPKHDIIDNRNEKLVDHINRILESTEAARFAVGYFFLSGFESIAGKLAEVQELRLLIGNTTSRDTLEQLAEGYRRLELVAEAAEEQAYPKRTDAQQMAVTTAENLREAIALMDQTDEGEALIKTLARMIEEKRLKVRVYTKGRLHAKAYIFDYHPEGRYEKGIAIVGSSNLTLSGVTHNTELNVVVQGNDNHEELVAWFEQLWDEAQDFDETLMHEMQQSWAMAQVSPYDIYMKTLYELVKDRLEGAEDVEILWDDEITQKLAEFQKVAVHQAVQIIRDYGGAFVADVVGLGKSYMGAAIVKHFTRTTGARPVIICPARLVDMWERYNKVYDLNAQVVSIGLLKEDNGNPNYLLENPLVQGRDFVLVDESHNFRHSDTQRYHVLQEFLKAGCKCCFLTATPRNKSAWDIYHQIKLFHQDDTTDLPIDPPNLRDYFRLVEHGQKHLPDLLSNLLIRRTRNHILRWYGYDSETHQQVDPTHFEQYRRGERRAYIMVGGRHQFFPERKLNTITYSIEDTYQGLYQQIRGYLGKSRKGPPKEPLLEALTYARYGLWHYVDRGKRKKEPYGSLQRAGANLCGLMRILLFKRFESSVHAFRRTISTLLRIHESFLKALENRIVPAGEDAQAVLYESDKMEEAQLLDALREVADRYDAADFDTELMRRHIQHDIRILRKILALAEPITPEMDAKLQTLFTELQKDPLDQGKCLIFTQYADTARYLYENLNPGQERDDIDVIYSGNKSIERVVGRFAPRANPQYKVRAGEPELDMVVATDVLAEGLNLQDCGKIINYDLHWNPVRLIQRFGRIDRIGTEHDQVYGFNFLPEIGIERNLHLSEKLRNRIDEIHETIGEDAPILDPSEQLNEEAMYAIYEQKGGQLGLFDEEEEESVDINEAEEYMRLMRGESPEEFERIANLRDGIRTAMASDTKGLYVFCQAGQYRQLFLVDQDGEVMSRDVPGVLGNIRCGSELEAAKLPEGYNAQVMQVKRLFDEQVKHRQAEREHTLSLTQGQRYVLRELRQSFGQADDEEAKARINILNEAFRVVNTTAINRELNRLRRNGVIGKPLLDALGLIYHQHNMSKALDHRRSGQMDRPVPRVVCSEGLV